MVFAYHPRLGHRARPWTISSPTSLVVDIKESTTHAAFFLVVLPSRLTLHLSFRVFVCLPLFGCLLALCVVLSPPPSPENNKCVPHRCFTDTSSHSTTLSPNPSLPNPLLPNPYCAPYTQPLGSTPVTHPQCHPPNLSIPFIPLSPLPSTIIHAPIWCRGRSPLTGPRAPCSLNGTNLVSCSAYATTRSGLSSTPPQGGGCGLDQIFRSQLPLPPGMVLLSVTPSNAPRQPGQPGWQSQLLSVRRSWIA